MTTPAVLNLHLCVREGCELEAVRQLQTALRAPEWKILAQLSAEVVSRWESAAQGQRVLFVPAAPGEAELALRALRLREAGRD